MKPYPRDKIHLIVCHECKPLHHTIVEQIYTLLEDPQTRKSHYFNGRYENIYISETRLPTISPILNTIREESARLLNGSIDELKIGFWFNLMQKDDVTLAHNHDDDDELISGTYYLQVPKDSGRLSIKIDAQTSKIIEPEEATLACFHPGLEHEVSQHLSPIPRISLGFNIGRITPDDAVSN